MKKLLNIDSGREAYHKKRKFRKKYRTLIRIKNIIHINWLGFKHWIKQKINEY